MSASTPHWSDKYNDVSWHAPWSCTAGGITAQGYLELYTYSAQEKKLVRVAQKTDTQEGQKGDFNIRYGGCHSGTHVFQGRARVTFSKPGYSSGTAKGASPENSVQCK